MRQFFKQILVITHIAEVQDAFDARVLVQKDPVKGSQVKVLKM
jgi:DNA repair exonuclease SbcCD ATPase subunit